MLIPRGTTEADFTAALEEFGRIVGREWVFAGGGDLAPYGDAFAPAKDQLHEPGAAIAPASVEEVSALVRAAARYKVPLWPVSTGRNLAYGGSAPVLPGTVVLDLRRMNRVLEVDNELGFAVVEPGVSFFDLQERLVAEGGKLWLSSPAPGWGSVMGNALERGFGPMPTGDHSAQICGMEVVLADGTVVRTGMGAVPAGECGPLFKHGFGPSWDLAFTQSNFAVVTKVGMWLMPRPEAFVSARVNLAREEDLGLAVDILRPLRLDGTINGIPNIRNDLGGAIAVSRREEWYTGEGPIPDGIKAEIRRKLGLGWWLLQYGIYGREDVVRAQATAVQRSFESIPGARIEAELFDAAAIATPDRGGAGSRAAIPSLNALGIVDWWGGSGGHIDFSPVFPPRGDDALKLHRLCRSIIEGAGLDYMGTFYNFGRAMALICAITFDREDEARTAALRPMFSRLIESTAAAGYGEYRTHVRYMDEVAGIYGWNDGALATLNARVKDALDPHGILAPGKQGIWPARLRT